MSDHIDINKGSLHSPPGFQIDLELLRQFEHGLDPHHPERSAIPARVLGYGEISTVFSIEADGLQDLAFKRLPIFYKPEEIVRYCSVYLEYNRLLEQEVGLHVASHGYAAFLSDTGRPVFYIIQRQEPSQSIGHRALHILSYQGAISLFEALLRELHKVWDFNQRQNRLTVALDGQISNWSIQGFTPDTPELSSPVSLVYMDTSTPLFRVEGQEQLDPELFLRSAPSFLRWVLRLLFLEDVVNRYYDFHLVAVDAIANLYKEQRPDLVPGFVQAANAFFAGEGVGLNVSPITEREVHSYYQEDRLIWSLYLSMRRLDRFLHTRLLRREYPYILPGKIKR